MFKCPSIYVISNFLVESELCKDDQVGIGEGGVGWTFPGNYSVIAQPRFVSPCINVLDVAVPMAERSNDSIGAALRANHPFGNYRARKTPCPDPEWIPTRLVFGGVAMDDHAYDVRISRRSANGFTDPSLEGKPGHCRLVYRSNRLDIVS